jgi:hypothetical protein
MAETREYVIELPDEVGVGEYRQVQKTGRTTASSVADAVGNLVFRSGIDRGLGRLIMSKLKDRGYSNFVHEVPEVLSADGSSLSAFDREKMQEYWLAYELNGSDGTPSLMAIGQARRLLSS